MNVSKGFYVHYKGGIYFVTGIALNGDSHNWQDQHVIYESVQGCGDDVEMQGPNMVAISSPTELHGSRFRTVEDFTRMIDWDSGLTEAEAAQAGVVNMGQYIPRFQRIVGWRYGRPLVADPDGKDNLADVFVSQVGNKTGIYQGACP